MNGVGVYGKTSGQQARPGDPTFAGSHLRLDLSFSDREWKLKLRRATAEAQALEVRLENALFLADRAEEELADLATALEILKPPAARRLVFPAGETVTQERDVHAVRSLLRPATPDAEIGGGTNAHFAELNRMRPPTKSLDCVCYSISPQVHAFDTVSLVENLSGQSEGDGGRHLRTFHPSGGHTSSEYFHGENWLDFNMYQSGHSRNRDCYNLIAGDYALKPTKPCMDAEPGYEDHPNGFKVENGYLDAYDVRKAAYWDLFAGAHGHTYGCHDIWQFLNTDHFPPVTAARTPWRDAIHLPGANQMQFARKLIESRPFLSRIPDPSLVVSGPEAGGDHVEATHGEDGSYAFVYIPSGKSVTVDLGLLSGQTIAAHWFDPRTEAAAPAGTFPQGQPQEFTPPAGGPDWVLTLDDQKRNFPAPGHLR